MAQFGLHANIPVNVHAALLSDASLSNSMQGFCSNGPMQTMILEDRFSNMTLDEAINTLRQLSNENHQLKATVQQCNESMNQACSKLTALKENENRKEKELREKAKITVETLQQRLAEKDKNIEMLSKQIQQQSVTSSSAGAQDDATKKLIADALLSERTAAMCKQQVIQLQAQLHYETVNHTKLRDSLQSAEEKFVTQQRKCDQLEKKLSDDANIIQNLRSHVKELQDSKKSEMKKNITLQHQLTQMRVEFEHLSSEYTKLMNSTSQISQEQDTLPMVIEHSLSLLPKMNDLMSSVIARNQESESEASKKDYEQRIDMLTAKVIAAEDSINLRDNQIQALKQHMKNFDKLETTIKEQRDEIDALTCQATVYKADFDAERKSREELNDKRLELQDKVERLEARLGADRRASPPVQHPLGANIPRYGAIDEEIHHNVRQVPPVFRLGSAIEETGEAGVNELEMERRLETVQLQTLNGDMNRVGQFDPEVILEAGAAGNYECPICQAVFPDHDSLHLHVNECIALTE